CGQRTGGPHGGGERSAPGRHPGAEGRELPARDRRLSRRARLQRAVMKRRIYAAGGAAIAALALALALALAGAVTTVAAEEPGRQRGPRAERLRARHGHNHHY